jgi:hypothetical protein
VKDDNPYTYGVFVAGDEAKLIPYVGFELAKRKAKKLSKEKPYTPILMTRAEDINYVIYLYMNGIKWSKSVRQD